MGKVNLRITLEIYAEGESYINPNTTEELQYKLQIAEVKVYYVRCKSSPT